MHSVETGEEREGEKSPAIGRWGKSKLIDGKKCCLFEDWSNTV